MVRGLTWRYYPDAFPPMWVSQNAAFGNYSIEEASGSDSPSYDVLNPMGLMVNCDGLPEAKAAAQADYERRIRSCLATPPAAPAALDVAVMVIEQLELADQGLANAYSATHNDYDRDRLASERLGLQRAIKIASATLTALKFEALATLKATRETA